uniref:Uncharacterized protein n=1 Tax=Anguilla anguilla TaxID=7936 RepID=A0A0E9TXK2_ANGAN
MVTHLFICTHVYLPALST